MPNAIHNAARSLAIALFCCATPAAIAATESAALTQLPTGAKLDPAGALYDLGNLPVNALLAPGGERLIVLSSGWREQGIQVVDRRSGAVLQTLPQTAAFLGLVFSADGKTLYASGGDADVVYRYAWDGQSAKALPPFVLAEKAEGKATRYAAGLAIPRDGRRLYVTENLSDTLAVLDVATGQVLERLATGLYPYAVAVAPNGTVYVSAWGGDGVAIFRPGKTGKLQASGSIVVGRRPSALLLNASGSRLFVASASTDRVMVVDPARRKVIATLLDPPPAGPHEGSTPNALALSKDGRRLFVAEADANAVAVFDLSARTAGVTGKAVSKARAADRLAGRIPVGWYPTAVLADRGDLLVIDAKGRGAGPNRGMAQPPEKLAKDSRDYTLGQLNGTLSVIPETALGDLPALSERVARANGWDRVRSAAVYPPFEHVIYIVKENRTYDQVFGDLPQGDGDTSLLFFPREVSPNHHALAERFGLFDRFFVNAEVSSQGHPWSTAAYVTDFTEKTVSSFYSDRRPGREEDGDEEDSASGYLWNLAIAKRVSLRVYGEYAEPVEGSNPTVYRSTKAALRPYTSPDYPAFDMKISDQKRLAVWLREFNGFVAAGKMPALQILHLPSDHTSGARPGQMTPRAHMADNDLALGRIVEALSASPFWKNTVIFALEDDAQAGPDHVDSHRSVMLAISAYNKGGVSHRFVNTTDVLATIEEILHLGNLSQFDHYGRPLREIFGTEADLTPYRPLVPPVPLDELNPAAGPAAQASAKLDLETVDASDDDLFNRILWRAIRGEDVPYPEPKRVSVKELTLAR
ncbi:MAG TPA: alkaline phosphatase family protein [Thermoanaerobaculia bacterium]|jgi:YVTN family beta-propeller protein|nr:alkaline phosphatase family protein [Thermoanaerobaculia bacterium]